MKRPAHLRAYRSLGGLFTFIYGLIYRYRARIGKEDLSRISERYGHAKIPRCTGLLVWIHGASVGECSLAMALADEMLAVQPGLQFLFTSQTMTSAELLTNNMKGNQNHQYLPMDTAKAMGRFLDHWRPDLGVLLESEIWPNLIMETRQRKTPLALVNARMNVKSRENWKRKHKTAKYLFSQFNWITAADGETATMLEEFTGKEVSRPGNLKTLIKPKAPAINALEELCSFAENRPVWLAASTHAGEENILLQAHKQVLQQYPDTLLILVPRHPERGQEVANLCQQNNMSYCLRSDHITTDRTVWVADTIGEMQYWLELAQIVFVGGSLTNDKGHNPLEAIIADKPVLSGNNVVSFFEIYNKLVQFGAATLTDTPEQISAEIITHFNSPKAALPAITKANKWITDDARKMTNQTIPPLLDLLHRVNK